MKNVFPVKNPLKLLCLFIVILICNHLQAQKAQSFWVKDNEVNIPEFDKKVESLLRDVGVPGMSLAVIGNNEVVYTNAYGYVEKDKAKKVNENTVFEACSLSKSLIVYMINKLLDKGEFDLDKPMYQYYEYQQAGVKILHHDERYKLLTPRMALNHSTGLENWRWENDEDKLEFIANPGEKYTYSGEGYHYLSEILEVLLQKRYETYIEESLIQPLGLKRTFTSFDRRFLVTKPTNYAIGHTNSGVVLEKDKDENPFPAGGVSINAADYARLIISLFDKQHFSTARVNEMIEGATTVVSENRKYGLGFEILFLDNDTIISHGGANDGFRGQMFYSLKNKTGLVFLTNSDLGTSLTKRLASLTMGFNTDPFFNPHAQYPSMGLELYKKWRKQGEQEMILTIRDSIDEGKVSVEDLHALAWMFFESDDLIEKIDIIKNIIDLSFSIDSESSESHYILGLALMYTEQYKEAYAHLVKAKELKYESAELDSEIGQCKQAFQSVRK